MEKQLIEAEITNVTKLWGSAYLEKELLNYSKTIKNYLKERRQKQDFASIWGYIYTSVSYIYELVF